MHKIVIIVNQISNKKTKYTLTKTLLKRVFSFGGSGLADGMVHPAS